MLRYAVGKTRKARDFLLGLWQHTRLRRGGGRDEPSESTQEAAISSGAALDVSGERGVVGVAIGGRGVVSHRVHAASGADELDPGISFLDRFADHSLLAENERRATRKAAAATASPEVMKARTAEARPRAPAPR
ncbi:hypothetical protein [Martelella mangrovi]|uniref:Uncharacterized protein n=1 Tax=Martelella mangrovi TaxID=1397477 RepID=A0ABV2IG41_9HYPH